MASSAEGALDRTNSEPNTPTTAHSDSTLPSTAPTGVTVSSTSPLSASPIGTAIVRSHMVQRVNVILAATNDIMGLWRTLTFLFGVSLFMVWCIADSLITNTTISIDYGFALWMFVHGTAIGVPLLYMLSAVSVHFVKRKLLPWVRTGGGTTATTGTHNCGQADYTGDYGIRVGSFSERLATMVLAGVGVTYNLMTVLDGSDWVYRSVNLLFAAYIAVLSALLFEGIPIRLDSCLARIGLVYMAASTAWIWWFNMEDETRHHLKSIIPISRLLSNGTTAESSHRIDFFHWWYTAAKAAGGEFWLQATGQLLILSFCAHDHRETERCDVEVGNARNHHVRINFGASTIGLLAGVALIVAVSISYYASVEQISKGGPNVALCTMEWSEMGIYAVMLLCAAAAIYRTRCLTADWVKLTKDALLEDVLIAPGLIGELLYAVCAIAGLLQDPKLVDGIGRAIAVIVIRFAQTLLQTTFLFLAKRMAHPARGGNQLTMLLGAGNFALFWLYVFQRMDNIHHITLLSRLGKRYAKWAVVTFSMLLFNRFHSVSLCFAVYRHLFNGHAEEQARIEPSIEENGHVATSAKAKHPPESVPGEGDFTAKRDEGTDGALEVQG